MYENWNTQGYGCYPHVASPLATLGETTTSYVFFFEIPGVKAEDIEVIVQGQYLSVRGKLNPAICDKEIELVQSERAFGPFQRTVAIPAPIDQEDVKAKLEDGILEIVLTKKTETNTPFKKVQVNKGSSKGHSSPSSKNN